MTGTELAEHIVLYFGFCKYFEPCGLPCRYCPHDTAWNMYILGLDMLETDCNPFI